MSDYTPALTYTLSLHDALPICSLERRRLDAYAAGLAEVVDLLALAVGAGLTVALAVDAVARRASGPLAVELGRVRDRKSTRLNSSHSQISYAGFCLKKKLTGWI